MTNLELAEKLSNRTKADIEEEKKKLGLRKPNRKHFFDEALDEFNKRGCICLSTESDYRDTSSKLRYICPKHADKGEQKISLNHLLQGRGCYYCGREKTENGKRTGLLDTSHDVELCQKCDFEYIDTIRENGILYIEFICNNHREVGIQRMKRGNMQRDFITGCRYCVNKKKLKFSKGEQAIEAFFKSHNITYIRQYVFPGCVDQRDLPFDFYLPDYNTVVEFDGQEHYHPVNFYGVSDEEAEKDFVDETRHDKIKDDYCADCGIDMLRIPYYKFKDINDILENKFLAK